MFKYLLQNFALFKKKYAKQQLLADVLFPYITRELDTYLNAHWSTPELQDDIDGFWFPKKNFSKDNY